MRFLKYVLVALALLVPGHAAQAQSACKYIVNGATLTAGQWNYCFQQKNDTLGYTPLPASGGTMSGPLTLAAPSTFAGLNFQLGTPTNPKNGDFWLDSTGLSFQLSGATRGPFNTSTYTGSSAPGAPNLYSFWNNTSGSTIPYSIYDGTQWVNIGTLNPSTHSWTAASGGSVTSFSAGSTGLTPSSATTGAITLAGTLNATHGGTGLTSGTSGGVPYFNSSTTLASSGALTANGLVIGGGAGVAPATTTTGTGVLTALGLSVNGSGALCLVTNCAMVTPNLGTPSAAVLTSATGLPLTTGVTGILPGANGGTANGFFAVAGPASSLKTFTFPNASANVLTDNAAVSGAQGGTGVANTGKTITIGANLITTGGATTFALGATGRTYTFPDAADTVVLLTQAQTLTNKTINCSNNTCTNFPAGALPTRQVLTSGTTYTTPANVRQLRIRIVGGGGGGAGSGTGGTGVVGSAGGNTTFNSYVATGGNPGTGGGTGSGVTTAGSNGSGAYSVLRIEGGSSATVTVGPATSNGAGSNGANSLLGSGGYNLQVAAANTGSGGGGAGIVAIANGQPGSGGGAGEYIELIINSPSASYTYAIGAGGGGGAAGTSGLAGASGGSGLIIVDEIY
jgi:hypothetical protein